MSVLLRSTMLLMVLLLASCSWARPLINDERPNLIPSDLIGTWIDPQYAGRWVFDAQGGFEAQRLPGRMIRSFRELWPSGFDADTGTFDGSGEWMLEGQIGEKEGPLNRVATSFRNIRGKGAVGYGNELTALRRGSEVVLSLFVGDADVAKPYVYEKCTEPCSK